MGRPRKYNTEAERDLENIDEQINQFSESISDINLESVRDAPVKEVEHRISQKEQIKSKVIRLTPKKVIWAPPVKVGDKFVPIKFNEDFRKQWEFDKQYVEFIAFNNEIGGESITLWTKKYPGTPSEEWVVPVGVKVAGPRYLAEQIKNSTYHSYQMEKSTTRGDVNGTTFHGSMVACNTVQRLDAMPVTTSRSVFMGASD